MWQRRSSQSEPSLSSTTSPSNPAYAYYSSSSYSSQMSRRGPIEGPPGHQLRRRVTWRSSAYKIIAYLYVLGILYIVWLIRDLFWLPFSSTSTHGGFSWVILRQNQRLTLVDLHLVRSRDNRHPSLA
ncbi:conserved hypothetical protein [Talaromyces stipitatus ATCC 10500]|uniref:Uncharacterized protein n=1 Tax=Talaromyces stipitatus (strain ATCC 10500 / CBS 375.48 / QM 6759 / NRRL 1006) TaxID=441959 RepID=B8MIQ1_TALSN|nr:uncharacterized protein TSTA_050010 [Talaromyces stipitatus ATCC 10500]EED15563.1 conserved hypothetical protein [Talaromyces stipitatus ATCC 10500]